MNLIDLIEVGTIYYPGNLYWLWDNITLDSRLNKDVLISKILRDCSSMHVMYNTCASFKAMSDAFFLKWEYQIGKLIDTLNYDYNPIWNKDGKITENHQSERIKEEKEGIDYNESVDNNVDENTNGTTENTVSADNSSGYQPESKTTDSGHLGRDEGTKTNSERDRTFNENEGFGEETVRIEQGNIGVTTTQQMIKEEQSLYEFNIYDWIVNKYKEDMFLKVW